MEGKVNRNGERRLLCTEEVFRKPERIVRNGERGDQPEWGVEVERRKEGRRGFGNLGRGKGIIGKRNGGRGEQQQ